MLSYVKRSIITAICIALCVVLPMAFHGIENAGSVICPMHIPVLLCGLVCGWPFGLLCGLAGPVMAMLLTGMPPLAYLPPMLVELAVYGLVAGFLMQVIRTRHLYADLYLSLILAMLAARLVAGVARALIFAAGSYSTGLWIGSYFVTSLPGTVLQLVLIPSLIYALMKSRLIPRRYPMR